MIANKKNGDSWNRSRHQPPESFWASYSDMMAGLLMVFSLTTVMTLLNIGERLIKPTEGVREWMKVVDKICNAKELRDIDNIEVNCETGALIINEKSLRFGFASTSLGDDAKKALKKAVPKYFEIIHRYPKFLNRIQTIEISGHTDRIDSGYANPYISRERAGQVLSFLLAEPTMMPFVELLMKKAVVSGYSATLFPKECQENKCDAARRVEIKIRLNETNALIEFLNILKDIIN